jgi:hypothetical protein
VDETVRHARRHTRRVLGRWEVRQDLIDTAVLIADEFVTNAIRHGDPPIRLTLVRLAHEIVIEVADGSAHMPRRLRADRDDEWGRGLHLVGAMSSRWGSRVTRFGKVVWAQVPTPCWPDAHLAGAAVTDGATPEVLPGVVPGGRHGPAARTLPAGPPTP